jgi:hypothetical protein
MASAKASSLPPSEEKDDRGRFPQAAQLAKKLAVLVNDNVQPEWGITNDLLQNVCREVCPALAECRSEKARRPMAIRPFVRPTPTPRPRPVTWRRPTFSLVTPPPGMRRCPHAGCPIRLHLTGPEHRGARFVAVHSTTDLPDARAVVAQLNADRKREMSYIVNRTSPNDTVTGHFVCLIAGLHVIAYVDPFGMRPPDARTDPALDSFLRVLSTADRYHRSSDHRNARSDFHPCHAKIIWNGRQIQAFRSKACGLFCLAFIFARELDIPLTSLKFHASDLARNDKRCAELIHSLLEPCLPV